MNTIFQLQFLWMAEYFLTSWATFSFPWIAPWSWLLFRSSNYLQMINRRPVTEWSGYPAPLSPAPSVAYPQVRFLRSQWGPPPPPATPWSTRAVVGRNGAVSITRRALSFALFCNAENWPGFFNSILPRWESQRSKLEGLANTRSFIRIENTRLYRPELKAFETINTRTISAMLHRYTEW